MSREDFEALVRRAGLGLSPKQVDELFLIWPQVAAMLDRNRSDARGREAEIALTFTPDQGGWGYAP